LKPTFHHGWRFRLHQLPILVWSWTNRGRRNCLVKVTLCSCRWVSQNLCECKVHGSMSQKSVTLLITSNPRCKFNIAMMFCLRNRLALLTKTLATTSRTYSKQLNEWLLRSLDPHRCYSANYALGLLEPVVSWI